jgi:hypothetical protein
MLAKLNHPCADEDTLTPSMDGLPSGRPPLCAGPGAWDRCSAQSVPLPPRQDEMDAADAGWRVHCSMPGTRQDMPLLKLHYIEIWRDPSPLLPSLISPPPRAQVHDHAECTKRR